MLIPNAPVNKDKPFFSLETQMFLHKNPPPPFDSPKEGWADITQEEIRLVLEKVAKRVRADYADLIKEYQIAYPGYEGYLDYYGRPLTEGSESKPGEKKSVLCYGIGSGHDFGIGAMENPNAVGIELSGDMIRALKKMHPTLKQHQIIQGDVLDTFRLTRHLTEESFDTVLAPYSFLQYISRDKMRKLMENTYNWLKPGGHFYADIFNAYLIPRPKMRRPNVFRRLAHLVCPWLKRTTLENVSGEKKTRELDVHMERTIERVRTTAYVIYQHMQQTMQEYTLIERPERGTEVVLGMDYHFHYPKDIVEPMKVAGLEDIEVYGDYKGKPFHEEEERGKQKRDMAEMNVFHAIKPAA